MTNVKSSNRVVEFYKWFWKDLSVFGICIMFPASLFIFPIIFFVILCVKKD